jgi:hypothetical protein
VSDQKEIAWFVFCFWVWGGLDGEAVRWWGGGIREVMIWIGWCMIVSRFRSAGWMDLANGVTLTCILFLAFLVENASPYQVHVLEALDGWRDLLAARGDLHDDVHAAPDLLHLHTRGVERKTR